jgi:hypothetical protein
MASLNLLSSGFLIGGGSRLVVALLFRVRSGFCGTLLVGT